MAEKVAKVGIKRDTNFMYFVKGGDIWRVPRKQPGKPKGKSEKVADVGAQQDPVHADVRSVVGAPDGRRGAAVDDGFHPDGRITRHNDVRFGTGADSGRTRLERELLIVELKDGHWGAMRGRITTRAI